jgi:AAA15 family ATPase/GTPase
MVASKDKSHENELYNYKNLKILREAVVYGANASGKTNLIEAVSYLKWLVVKGGNLQEGDEIPRSYHKLSKVKPTSFDVQFVVEGIRYAYGFSLTDEKVEKEYLYHYPSGRQAKIFEREQENFTFGISYKKDLREISTKSKKNKLFLNTAEAWSSLPEIINPFRFFKENIVINLNRPDNWFEYSARKIEEDSRVKKLLIDFLRKIDMPVTDIKVKIEENAPIPAQISTLINQLNIVSDSISSTKVEVKFVYEDFELNFDEESLGTQKLFKLICPFVDVLINGKILFYDELENSLHPVIVQELIEVFKKWDDDSKAQLIFTTHDTSLLNLELFRRDQIWFAERNPASCSSEYYSLIELKNVRKDENIRKGFITGRYSSIPLKGNSLIEILKDEDFKNERD